jgi:hypothetical protein
MLVAGILINRFGMAILSLIVFLVAPLLAQQFRRYKTA